MSGLPSARVLSAGIATLLACALAAIALARAGDGANHSAMRPLVQQPLAHLLRHACTPRPATPAQRQNLLLGLSANLRGLIQRAAKCAQAQLARDAGAAALREDISWAEVQPRYGVFRWRRFDAVLAAASIKGLRVLPVLDTSPRWAARTANTVPADPRAFATFVAAAVKRYGVRGSYWRHHPAWAPLALGWFELWNEPYLRDPAAAAPNPRHYAQLASAAVQAGRATDPSARFLLEAESVYTAGDGSARGWVEDMYAAVPTLSRYLDAVAVHPYSGTSPTTYTPGDSRHQSRRLEQVRASFVAHGAVVPFWITEIGWPTCSSSECVSEAHQATYLHELLALARGTWKDYVRAVFVFGLNDAISRRSDREASYGVLRADLSRKPAWAVLRAGQ